MARQISGPVISGRVVNKSTGAPLANVVVTPSAHLWSDREFQNTITTVTTSGDGSFQAYASPGQYTFTCADASAAPIEAVEVVSVDQGTNAASAGSQGAAGAQGAAGSQGASGAQGAAGAQGAGGAAGAQGTAGSNGAQGAQGAAGAQGAQGVNGTTAVFPVGTQGSSGSAFTLPATATDALATVTLSANTTITTATANQGARQLVCITQGASVFTAAWTTVDWGDAGVPSFPTVNKRYYVQLICGVSGWDGFLLPGGF